MKNRTLQKRLSALLCLILIVLSCFVSWKVWPALSIGFAGALLLLYFTPERIEDERVEHLKLKAVQGGFGCSFSVALLLTWLGRRPGGGVSVPVYLPSAFDLIIVAMLIALGLFYYWRWQDARPGPNA